MRPITRNNGGSANAAAAAAATSVASSGSSSCNSNTSLGTSVAPLSPSVAQCGSSSSTSSSTVVLITLPAEILVKIFSYLSFKKTSECRSVSRRFNEICASLLNVTFQRLQSLMLRRFHDIKSQMPRRESARRNHPLARESDIVETLHMRLTLLQMTFGKHIERKHVCFFAGEILDEVYKILSYIRNTPNLGRAYKVTDELFDLSTMAVEYFKDNIEPTLPEITYFGAEFLDFTTPFSSPTKRRNRSGGGFDSPCSSRASVAGSSCSEPWSAASGDSGMLDPPPTAVLPPSNMVLRKRIRRIRQGMKRYNDQLVEVKRELKTTKSKMESQTKIVQDYTQRLEQYDQKFEESSRKFQTLLTELNKCKTELQYWRSKSSVLSGLSSNCSRCEAPIGENNSGTIDGGIKSEEDLKTLANQGIIPAKVVPSSSRKRRSRDEDDSSPSATSADTLPVVSESSTSRKSLRGIGVKNTSTRAAAAAAAAAIKRPKLS